MPALHLLITGTVQGVFFRRHAKIMAEELGIVGWVRNLSDGTVEVHAEGSTDALQKFTAWCHRGPPLARVTAVHVTQAPESGFPDFSILSA